MTDIYSVYRVDKIEVPTGEIIAGITVYRDYLVAITDRGTIIRIILTEH